MWWFEVVSKPTDATVARVEDLLDRTRRDDGSRSLSDHLWIDLRAGGDDRFAAVLAARHEGGPLAGYAQASTAAGGHTVETVVDRALDADRSLLDELFARLLVALADRVGSDEGEQVTWWVADPDEHHERLATRHGLSATRTLLQMRLDLPVDRPATVATRAFRPGVDDEAWLDVNNRAFAGHGEQASWDAQTLRSRFAEPWFRAEDFLVLDHDGPLIGSCWTKTHADTDPPMGEIYVVSVDPDHHGHGHGVQLTLAGLEAIHARGLDTAMLYVDADNEAALHVYRRLGFRVHRTDRAFTGPLEVATTNQGTNRGMPRDAGGDVGADADADGEHRGPSRDGQVA